ncbi:MAG: hypothetical protein EHM27_16840 [Deltaproteobacteria bacterium]|nr:MAG: hypothetical protein EHM27_16840 [Deltaproteobacteria bacterium]
MPQVEAGQAGEWDVGAIGTVPCLFAGVKYKQPLIAISNDESVTNNLMVRPDAFNTWLKDPKKDLKGKTFLVSTISTGHYAVVAYLKKLGLTESDVKIVHMEQSAILSAFLSGQGDCGPDLGPLQLHDGGERDEGPLPREGCRGDDPGRGGGNSEVRRRKAGTRGQMAQGVYARRRFHDRQPPGIRQTPGQILPREVWNQPLGRNLPKGI